MQTTRVWFYKHNAEAQPKTKRIRGWKKTRRDHNEANK